MGLPEIADNICEGVVIRPIITPHFNHGVRVILKKKNEAWAEGKQFRKSIKKEEKLPEKIVKLREAILTYVTENRLNNVLSKVGQVTIKDFGKVMGMFSKDIVEDFSKDYQEVLSELESYKKMGMRAFVLSGYPHIDECKHFGQRVLPQLKTCSLPHAYGRVPSDTPLTPLGAGVRR